MIILLAVLPIALFALMISSQVWIRSHRANCNQAVRHLGLTHARHLRYDEIHAAG